MRGSGRGLRHATLGLAVALAALPAGASAQGAGRSPALRTPVVEDVTGRVLGPVVGVDQVGGTDAEEASAVTVALGVNDTAVLIAVARDRFPNAPLMIAADPSGIRGGPLNLLFFAEPGCTGPAFIASGTGGTPAPSALRRAAIGPGNVLYVEPGPSLTVPHASYFVASLEPQCFVGGGPVTAVPAAPEAHLDDLYTPPFSVRLR